MTNLVETVQNDLGLPPIKKIDPNIQETKEKNLQTPEEKLAQAAIPAVLTALYSFTRFDEGCSVILSKTERSDWLHVLFAGKENIAVKRVADYAVVSKAEAKKLMQKIAKEAVEVLKKEAGEDPTIESVRTVMDFQRHNILVRLPAAMQMGDLLNEETLDDRTNKMEGPVSNFLHKIEDILSKGGKSKYP
jgi:hypothetical protein